MKFLNISLLVVLLVIGCKSQAADTIFVKNQHELMRSISSNKVLILNEAHYQLSAIELECTNIENLSIIGANDAQVKVTTGSASNNVLKFKNSKNIHLENLSLGHWPNKGYCIGNVLSFYDCDSIFINNCDIFGCGVYGIEAINTTQLWCSKSVIRDCSNGIIDANYSSSLIFSDCSFYLGEGEKFDFPQPWFKHCDFFTSDSTVISKNYNGYYPKAPVEHNARIVQDIFFEEEFSYDDFIFEYSCPKTVTVTSSSSLSPSGNINYDAPNILKDGEDFNQHAWVEGASAYGIGEKISFVFKSKYASDEAWRFDCEFYIINGYAKSKELWEANGRVKRFNVYRNAVLVAYVNLQDTPVPQSMYLHEVFYKNKVCVGEGITFEIAEVYKGSKYEDTAITLFIPQCGP